MARDTNIDLDIDSIRIGDDQQEISRLTVVTACGYTRDGTAPTLTADCTNLTSLRREADRLKEEIDDALSRAAEHYGGSKRAKQETPRRPEARARSLRSHIDSKLSVRDVMTKNVRTVGPNDPLSVVDELMKVGRFRHVVVVDGVVVGVISQRDIFHGALAWSLGQGEVAHRKTLETYPAKQVMETRFKSIDPDAPLGEAASLMITHKIGCLPVVDGDELVGILTEGDFLALIASSSPNE